MAQNRKEWLIFAIASGGCAALNGAFAKLTTTKLTASWASGISHFLGVEESTTAVEYLVRIVSSAGFILIVTCSETEYE